MVRCALAQKMSSCSDGGMSCTVARASMICWLRCLESMNFTPRCSSSVGRFLLRQYACTQQDEAHEGDTTGASILLLASRQARVAAARGAEANIGTANATRPQEQFPVSLGDAQPRSS